MTKDKPKFILIKATPPDLVEILAKNAKNTKMLEICVSEKNASIEHINNLPKGYGYYVKRIK